MVSIQELDLGRAGRQIRVMLIAALLLTAPIAHPGAASSGPCEAHPLGWMCAAEGIIARPPSEQAVMYLILEAAAAEDVKKLKADTPRDRCWIAKVAGFEYAMLSMAAPDGSPMDAYYKGISEAYQAAVSGKMSYDELVIRIEATRRPTEPRPSEEAMQAAIDGDLVAPIENATDALIAFAKVAADKFKPGCAGA